MLCFFYDCIAVDKSGELMTSTAPEQSLVSVKLNSVRFSQSAVKRSISASRITRLRCAINTVTTVHLYLTLDTFSSRVCSVVVNSRSLTNKNIYYNNHTIFDMCISQVFHTIIFLAF